MQRFSNDDAGYLAWLRDNPAGFLLNHHRQPSGEYWILHRAWCGKVTTRPANGQSWTGKYVKVCASDPQILSLWAKDQIGHALKACPICKPHEARF